MDNEGTVERWLHLHRQSLTNLLMPKLADQMQLLLDKLVGQVQLLMPLSKKVTTLIMQKT
jgi:hypothetical protein